MDKFQIGDLVVLNSGSMRMAVEAEENGQVACVWCHEGEIGRDTFDGRLLKKWEHREDDRSARSDGPRPYRGDREGGGRPYRGKGEDRGDRSHGKGDDREDRPRGKTGWDGKPREKKYFRKD